VNCTNIKKGGNKMQEIISYLKRFQAWRTGEDERDLYEAGLTPEKTTEAINKAIEYIEKMEKEKCLK